MKKIVFTLNIEKDADTNLYVGEVLRFPGCHTQGKTLDELMKNIKEVMELCIEMKNI